MFFMLRKLVKGYKPSAEGQRKKTFTYEEILQATDGFSDKNLISRDGLAYVYKGLFKDGRVVAVKRLMNGGEEGEREFRTEIRNIGGLHPHKHVVSLIGHCITQEKRILVYEFVPNGSLYSRLHGKGEPIIDWSTRIKIAIGSARGIAYLHHECNPTIIHRDIKSANILLDENYDAKISDFVLAKWKPEDDTDLFTRITGTYGYLAPEYEATGHVTEKTDIYSFGVVLIELITGQRPGARYGRSKDELLVDWVRPYLIRSIQDRNYGVIADPRLNGNYDKIEMERMAACALSCTRHEAELRRTMNLVIMILEGEIEVNVLNNNLSISNSASETLDSIQQVSRSANYTESRHSSEALTNSDSGTRTKRIYFTGEAHKEKTQSALVLPSSQFHVSPPPPPRVQSLDTCTEDREYKGPIASQPHPHPHDLDFGSKHTFTYKELMDATHGFSHYNYLGKGAFGHVYKGVLSNGKTVAVKQLKPDSWQGKREFEAEIDTISHVHHKHLLSFVGYCKEGNKMLLVYEFVPNQTLEFHLHEGNAVMDWPTRMKIALGSAKGLAYLHEDCNPKIIHRDIKAANILLGSNFEPQVADFGLAKMFADSDTHVTTRVVGTFGYLAPEYAASGRLTEKSDVFSFGVILLELITGRRPIDKARLFVNDSMVDWAKPLLARAMKDGNYDILIDERLNNRYDRKEMACMVACAAACIRHSAQLRPQMSQVVFSLRQSSMEDLNKGLEPGYSSVYITPEYASVDELDYRNVGQKNFGSEAPVIEKRRSSEYGESTGEYVETSTRSSSEVQHFTGR